MPLIIEDGTAKVDADSYVTVDEANTYLAGRGRTLWATNMLDVEKEHALRRACDYMMQFYRLAWSGSRKTSTQRLDWPRVWVPIPDANRWYSNSWYGYGYFDSNSVPQDVKNAQIELALKAAAGPLTQDITRLTKSETVGPISVTYADNTSKQYPKYPEIDNMLGPWLNANGTALKMARG